MAYPAELFEALDALIASCKAQVVTATELKKGLRMADLLGKKPSEVGVLRHHFTNPTCHYRPWVGAKLVITDGDEKPQWFSLLEVHHDLWPADVLAAYRRYEARKARL